MRVGAFRGVWENAGTVPLGVKRVGSNKGDRGIPEYRCRLVAKEIKKGKPEDLLASPPPLEATSMLSFSLGEHTGDALGLRRHGSC